MQGDMRSSNRLSRKRSIIVRINKNKLMSEKNTKIFIFDAKCVKKSKVKIFYSTLARQMKH